MMAHPQAQHPSNAAKETLHQRPKTRSLPRTPVALPDQMVAQALQRAQQSPPLAGAADLLALQRAVGNRAVSRLLVQARLTVGPAGDQYEQQADRVADQVLAMPGPVASAPEAGRGLRGVQRQAEEEEEVQTKPDAQAQSGWSVAASITPLVQRQEEEEDVLQGKPLIQRQAEEEEEVQTKPLIQRRADGAFEATPAFESHLASQKGAGSPLPGDVRSYMEPRFGADFGGVRLHTGSQAVQMNQAIRAQAFTHGHDIYLGERTPDLSSGAGKRLLAHELTHVIQQAGGAQRISCWGGLGKTTSHKILTEEAFQGVDGFSNSAKEYLKEMSEAVDMRVSFFATVGLGKFKELFSKMAKDSNAYDNLVGYWRNPGEAPNHAEGGMYQVPGGDPSKSEARINEFMRDAEKHWKTKDPRASLASLGLALHVAEDRGSHGEGAEGTGHDPRRMIKPPQGAKKNFYQAGWKGNMCDLRDKNEDGYKLGVKEARAVLKAFRDFVLQQSGTTEGLEQFQGPGMLKYLGRRAAMFFGYGAKSHKIEGKKPPKGGKPTLPPNVMGELKLKLKGRPVIDV
jgi:hypothetical protein